MLNLWEGAKSKAKYPDLLEMIWFIDDDDQESLDLANKLGHKYLSLPRYSVKLSDAINQCYELSKKEIIFGVGDDLVFHSQDWDQYARDCFTRNDNLVVCGGRDGLNNDLITHFMIHKRWIDIVGYFVPPGYRDMYVDTFCNSVARMVGRLEWLPIYIEHKHYTNGGPYDQTAQERMANVNKGDESGQLYLQSTMSRIQDAHKIFAHL
jgi:hypothetical protein